MQTFLWTLQGETTVAEAQINIKSQLGIRRIFAQRHALSYSEQVPVEQLVHSLCDQKQGYTQFGGLRPFGVSFLFAGWYDQNKVATTPWVCFMPLLTLQG